MQLKLLNFHKILSQFSTNITGAFIALIVYQSTNSFVYAFLYMAISMFLRILITKIFYNSMAKKPQLFLLIRIFPFLFYLLSLLLLDTEYVTLGIFLSLIFFAFSVSFNETPMEFVFNYSATQKESSNYGFSRLLENIGYICAIILGGLFLDNLPKIYVIIVACSTYLISVIPLFIYYLKNKKQKDFNKDSTSNAVESFKNIKIKKQQQKIVTRQILNRYFFIYFVFCVYDALMPLLSLYIFKTNAQSYGFVSYIQATFYSAFGLGCFIAGKLDEKKDLTKTVAINCLASGLLVCCVPFFSNVIFIEIILFGLIGIMYSFVSIFCYSRLMSRCKIMGIGNTALYNRSQASRFSQTSIYIFASFSAVMFIPTFILVGIVFASCSIFIPKNEEDTRKILVDYLQNNKLY